MDLSEKKQEVLEFLNYEYDNYRNKPNLNINGLFDETFIRVSIFYKTSDQMNELPLILNELKKLEYINNIQDKYIITLAGKEFLTNGGFKLNNHQKFKRFFKKEENIWKIISPLIAFVLGLILSLVTCKC